METIQHRLKTELFSVAMKHIYMYDRSVIGVCERDQRERENREKTGIKIVCLEDCFQLH